MGFISSKKFVLFIQKKIQAFLNSQLHFGIKSMNIFDSDKDSILFLGLSLKLLYLKKNSHIEVLSINRKYFSRVFSRLVRNQRKLDKLSLERFNSEISVIMENVLYKNKVKQFLNKKDKIWHYIFQLEAIRSIRPSKLILTNDIQFLLTEEFFSFIKESTIGEYRRYAFDLYNSRIQILFKDIIKDFSPIINKSISSIDLALSYFLLELKKKVILLYNEYYVKNDISYSELYITNNFKLHQISSLYNINFYKNDLLSLKINSFFPKDFINLYKRLGVFVPIDFLFNKLIVLGFLHPLKKRPVGNSRFLVFEDSFIIVRVKNFIFNCFMFKTFLYRFINLCQGTI
jgi:hypothetical protein